MTDSIGASPQAVQRAEVMAALKAALPELTRPFVGTQRSYEDLVNAAAAVTRYLQRDLGFYLGYAYLPEQSPEGGRVRIAVLEGRLDEVVLDWPEGMPVRREVVEAYLARLKPGEILHVRDVEREAFARELLYQGHLPGLKDELNGVENLRAEWHYGTVLPSNWKIAMEAFMEGYHTMQTHPQLHWLSPRSDLGPDGGACFTGM